MLIGAQAAVGAPSSISSARGGAERPPYVAGASNGVSGKLDIMISRTWYIIRSYDRLPPHCRLPDGVHIVVAVCCKPKDSRFGTIITRRIKTSVCQRVHLTYIVRVRLV